MHASNKTVSEDEEEDDVFSRRPLYCGYAGSDVMGCRRPTGGVFTYVSSDTSHAEGVPHGNPFIRLPALAAVGPESREFEVPMEGNIQCLFQRAAAFST